jgi:hypothetical protein
MSVLDGLGHYYLDWDSLGCIWKNIIFESFEIRTSTFSFLGGVIAMKFGVIAMKFSMGSDRNEIWSDRNEI